MPARSSESALMLAGCGDTDATASSMPRSAEKSGISP